MNGKDKRLTIAICMDWMYDDYQVPIWKSIADEAEKRDINVMIFNGGMITNLEYDQDRNQQISTEMSIHNLINPSRIDGIIVISLFYRCEAYKAEILPFLENLGPLPLVTIGEKIGDYPSICIDNKGASYQITKHLIVEHDCRRFLYVAGPENDMESNLRIRGFRQALAEAGLPFSTQNLLQGKFINYIAKDLTTALIMEDRFDYDGVVCANDHMALGVIETLSDHGFKLPEEVVVVGFDDIADSRNVAPALTTVKQPFKKLGIRALDTLLAIINSQEYNTDYYLPTRMIIRQSCGCNMTTSADFPVPSRENESEPEGTLGNRDIIVSDIFSKMVISIEKKELLKKWFHNLRRAITAYMKNRETMEKEIFPLTSQIFNTLNEMDLISFWFPLLLEFQKTMLQHFFKAEDASQVIYVFEQLILHLTSTHLHRDISQKRVHWRTLSSYAPTLQFLTSAMFAMNMKEIIDAITSRFPVFGFNSCYIIKYKERIKLKNSILYQRPSQAEALLVFRDKERIEITEQEREFPTEEIVPGSHFPKERFTLIVLPLLYNLNSFGFIIFPLCDLQLDIYRELQFTIGDSIMNVLNMEELKTAKVQADYANRAKSEFLANMSHEIRTPLNSILGFTDILLEEEKDPDKIDKLKTVSISGGNLVKIINDILDFSKMEAGKMELCLDNFSVPELAEHMEKMFSVKTRKKNVRFCVNLSPDIPEILIGDQHRISQVLINLLGNAFKFTEEGRVSLDMNFKDLKLNLIITDSGIGIPSEKMEKIFSPFSQVESSTRHRFEGTGLGLAITRKLIEEMHGTISIKSEVGRGSVFTIKIPLQVPLDQILPLKQQPEEEESPSLSRADWEDLSRDFTILVAEDNELNRKLFESLLKKMNLVASFVENGQQALEYLEHNRYDLLILDMQMPVLDGLRTIKRIRKNSRFRDLYTIAVTAHALSGEAEKCLEAGCDDYIPKPIVKNLFRQKILSRMRAKKHQPPEAVFTEKKPHPPSLENLSGTDWTPDQLHSFTEIISGLKKCLMIFDNEVVKRYADKLGRIGSADILESMRQQLYKAADNYNPEVLECIIENLQELISENGLSHT